MGNDISAQKLRYQIHVPQECVGLIVGQRGRTAKAIEEDTGASVRTPSRDIAPDRDGLVPVTVLGRPDAIFAAAKEIERIVPENQCVATADLMLERPQIGQIIGPRGATIKKLEEQSGASIRAPQRGDPNPMLMIDGDVEEVERAFRGIAEELKNPPRSMLERRHKDGPDVRTVVVHIPTGSSGLLVGRGGQTISRITRDSGAEINLDPRNNAVVHIIGTDAQIRKATERIDSVVGIVSGGGKEGGSSSGAGGGGVGAASGPGGANAASAVRKPDPKRPFIVEGAANENTLVKFSEYKGQVSNKLRSEQVYVVEAVSGIEAELSQAEQAARGSSMSTRLPLPENNTKLTCERLKYVLDTIENRRKTSGSPFSTQIECQLGTVVFYRVPPSLLGRSITVESLVKKVLSDDIRYSFDPNDAFLDRPDITQLKSTENVVEYAVSVTPANPPPEQQQQQQHGYRQSRNRHNKKYNRPGVKPTKLLFSLNPQTGEVECGLDIPEAKEMVIDHLFLNSDFDFRLLVETHPLRIPPPMDFRRYAQDTKIVDGQLVLPDDRDVRVLSLKRFVRNEYPVPSGDVVVFRKDIETLPKPHASKGDHAEDKDTPATESKTDETKKEEPATEGKGKDKTDGTEKEEPATEGKDKETEDHDHDNDADHDEHDQDRKEHPVRRRLALRFNPISQYLESSSKSDGAHPAASKEVPNMVVSFVKEIRALVGSSSEEAA